MKVLFLDFDGVLNSERYVRSCGEYGVIIDPSRMLLLRQIIDSTSAKIVLSTSWREHWDKDESLCDGAGKQINEIFKAYGLEIFDKTPKTGKDREKEIEEWLFSNPGVEAFAVLDDAFLCADFLNEKFVRTSNWKNGLDEEGVEKAIGILNFPDRNEED